MPNCNSTINATNRGIADDRGLGPYAEVQVTITSASGSIINFSALGTDGTIHTYSALWGDTAVMWAACPSTLPSSAVVDAPGNPPTSGSGTLYLHEDYITTQSPPIAGDPKWPKNLCETTIYKELSVSPTSVELKVVFTQSDGQLSRATINLLDTALAKPDQTISFNGGGVTLRLSKDGFAAFGRSVLFDERQ